jgi:hypothetical protein
VSDTSTGPSDSAPPKVGLPAVDRRELLEVLFKVAAFLAGIVYASGFVVVVFDHARYGIYDLDLLRPRIVAAGVLFWAICAVSVLLAFRTFGRRGLRDAEVVSTASERSTKARVIRDGGNYFVVCLAVVQFSRVLFDSRDTSPVLQWKASWIVLIVLGILCTILVGRVAKRLGCPRVVADGVVFAVGDIGFALIFLTFLGKDEVALAGWCFLIGLVSVKVDTIVLSATPRGFLSSRWETSIWMSLLLVPLYAANLYPRVSPKWGGGKPVPAMLFLRAEQSYLKGLEVAVRIIDETSSGFYVEDSAQPPGAVFVPRDLVAGIRYSAVPKPAPKAAVENLAPTP